MARLIPQIPRDCVASERLLYERLGRELSDEWIVLHSLELTTHEAKMWGETDLVILSTKGIFVIEVKGGRVSCSDGMWRFESLNGKRSYEKQESPWNQASSAATAIRNRLKEDKRFSQCLVGYGVAMPFETFTTKGEEIIQEVLWDRRDKKSNLQLFVGKVARYWTERFEFTRDRPPRELSIDDLVEIRKLLRPDVDSHFSLGSYLTDIDAELIELTKAQSRTLRGMHANPRTIVSGFAGTGKTILAVERAIQYKKDGASVIFLCYNRLLAEHVREDLAEKKIDGIDVFHLHGLYSDTIKQAGMSWPKQRSEDDRVFFGQTLPEAFVEAGLTVDLEPYDVVVVDEAQDLMTPYHLDAIDLLVKDGFALGRWHLFLDPHQDIYGQMSEEAHKRLLDVGFASFELTVNCRNTREVATQTAVVSGFDGALDAVVDGPECEVVFCSETEALALLESKVEQLSNNDLCIGDVIVLSARQLKNSVLAGQSTIGGYALVDLSEQRPAENSLAFCTMHAFKGLERKCVIAIDLTDLDDEIYSLLHYTGLSRAKTHLILFASKSLESAYKRHLEDFGVRLARRTSA